MSDGDDALTNASKVHLKVIAFAAAQGKFPNRDALGSVEVESVLILQQPARRRQQVIDGVPSANLAENGAPRFIGLPRKLERQ
jgi:hypothetical protein